MREIVRQSPQSPPLEAWNGPRLFNSRNRSPLRRQLARYDGTQTSSLWAKQACNLFRNTAAPKTFGAGRHRFKACVPPPAGDRRITRAAPRHSRYRRSGSGSDLLGSIDVRFAVAALTKSKLNAIGRATLLSSLDGKVE